MSEVVRTGQHVMVLQELDQLLVVVALSDSLVCK